MKHRNIAPAILMLLLQLTVPVRAEEVPEQVEQTQYISIELVSTGQESPMVYVEENLLYWNNRVTIDVQTHSRAQMDFGTDRKIHGSEVPNYYQTDYPNVRYGNGTVATSGCSITCLAMVATYLTGHTYTPEELAGYFGGRAFSNMARLEEGSAALQLPFHKAENWHESLQALRDGKVVIALMEEPSLFTASQHFIVLAGMTADGKILVNDPYRPNSEVWNLQNGFSCGFSEGDILLGYSGGWIYDKSAVSSDPFIYREEKPARQYRYPDWQLSYEDTELIARVVWVEARGESMEGQQAVAEVIFNRMASDDFPSALQDVIYGEGQFRSVPFLQEATPWQAQYDAIERALYGPYVLPMDVMYFAQTPTNDNVWGRIGGHVFCHQGGNENEI